MAQVQMAPQCREDQELKWLRSLKEAGLALATTSESLEMEVNVQKLESEPSVGDGEEPMQAHSDHDDDSFSDLQVFNAARAAAYGENPSSEPVPPPSSSSSSWPELEVGRKKVGGKVVLCPPPVPVRRLPRIQIGEYDIQSLYHSSYPSTYDTAEKIYICEFCLKFMQSWEFLTCHRGRCRKWHPPGNEIYRKDGLSVFEVDGRTSTVYCINLCLLSKLFLKDKVLFYDVEPFLFYVLCRFDQGFRLLGYFSKPKVQGECNLSCVMVLPPYQRLGYGRFLIDFSYFLSRSDGTWGTPDRPLSEFGQVAYSSYWRSALLHFFHQLGREATEADGGVRIYQIRMATGINALDILHTLVKLRFLRRSSDNNEIFTTSRFVLRIDWEMVAACVARDAKSSTRIYVDPAAFKPVPKNGGCDYSGEKLPVKEEKGESECSSDILSPTSSNHVDSSRQDLTWEYCYSRSKLCMPTSGVPTTTRGLSQKIYKECVQDSFL